MTKGDEIRLVAPVGIFDNIGEVCKVTNVSEDGIISFKFGGCHLGCMSYNEFEKYFEFVEREEAEELENKDMTENGEIYELLEWCKEKDKPFYPNLYLNVAAKRQDDIKSILGMYKNRLCLVQYKNKTFKDSDFSTLKILI